MSTVQSIQMAKNSFTNLCFLNGLENVYQASTT